MILDWRILSQREQVMVAQHLEVKSLQTHEIEVELVYDMVRESGIHLERLKLMKTVSLCEKADDDSVGPGWLDCDELSLLDESRR